MKLTTHIILRLLVPLTIGVVVLGLLPVVLIFTQSPAWIARIESAVLSAQVASFAARSQSRALVVQAVVDGFSRDAAVAGAFARDLFGLGGTSASNPSSNSPGFIPSSSPIPLAVARPFTNYFGAALDGNAPPQPPASLANLTSFFFDARITTAAQFAAVAPNSTVLDVALRALFVNKPNTQAWQLGLSDRFSWRRFPYSLNQTNIDYYRQQTPCLTFDQAPADLRSTSGYIPACRLWYVMSQKAASLPGATSSGLGPVIFTPPYSDTVTKRVKIVASQAFVDANNGFYGAVAVDFKMQYIQDQLTKQPVLTNGYIYMMDSNGTMIVYPSSKVAAGRDIYAVTTSIADLEFGGDMTAFAGFLRTVKSLAVSGGTSQFSKPGSSDMWYVAARAVKNTDYFVVTVVPSGDISALSSQLRSRTLLFGAVTGAVFIAVLVVVGLITYRITIAQCNKVLAPVAELSSFLTNISKANLHVELGNDAPVSSEISMIHEHFKYLLIAVRFGNSAYYANDLQRALQNYEAAERMMVQFRNERGRGVCLNNKGNTYKQMENKFNEALQAYTLAIQNAEALIASEQDPTRRRAYEIVLANRQMNLGVLFKEYEPATSETLSRAEFCFSESLRLHRKCDNVEGIAQVSGNLGQLYLKLGRIDEATNLMRDSYEISRQRGNPVSLQYAMMNLGILAEHLNHLDEAVAWYLYVIQRFKIVVSYVQRFCYEHVIQICEMESFNRRDIADTLREVGTPLYGSGGRSGSGAPKDIAFVLDCSGSMSGSFIRACRESIVTIISSYTNSGDRISLTTFQNHARVVFPPTIKSQETLPSMVHAVNNNTETGSTTAFWDALDQAAAGINTANPGGPQERQVWIVALTDGFDNASNPASRSQVLQRLRSLGYIGLIVITVGSLQNEHEIRQACEASRDGGMLIRAETSGDAIRDAFGRAAQLMTGNLNVESL